MNTLELATHHRAWLAQGQSLVAENIANANTPGYTAKSAEAFATFIEGRPARPTLTHTSHILPMAAPPTNTLDPETTPGSSDSGNTVDLDTEFMRAGEIRGGYALNTSLVKALHRMLQAVVRS